MIKDSVLVKISIFFVLLSLTLQVGCQTANNLFLEREVVTEHPDYVKSYYVDNPNWWRYKEFEEIRNSIDRYLTTHPNVSTEISTALKKIYIQKGMTKEEVALLLGQPNLVEQIQGEDVLIYNKQQGIYAKVPWDVKTFRLNFRNDQLVYIEVERIIIYK